MDIILVVEIIFITNKNARKAQRRRFINMMNNFKKLFALVLALALTMSMTSALAGDDYDLNDLRHEVRDWGQPVVIVEADDCFVVTTEEGIYHIPFEPEEEITDGMVTCYQWWLFETLYDEGFSSEQIDAVMQTILLFPDEAIYSSDFLEMLDEYFEEYLGF